ncbi:MAG TPA: class I SAM-dependent methyltransferase [Solirubrobacteraceae bacterium]|nr:class I SAM-dependent methyltransferase [Solirubrobacteraceae bacterium]
MVVVRSAAEIRDVNTRYHDGAAATYDAKWGIDFGPVGQAQVLSKVRKALGGRPQGYPQSLEIGAGTGYFSLNLLRAGVVREATCTDISEGMVAMLAENATQLGLNVRAMRADAESLPFEGASFDLVLGHAVLHHLPDLARAFAEFHRVLRPGGRIVFAGEPSLIGDRLASIPKRSAAAVAPLWRALLRADVASIDKSDGQLESSVDIHAFTPGTLTTYARAAGFEEVAVGGEELLANWFGWFNRALEATADPDAVPMLWRHYAHGGYLLLQRLDGRVLEPRLPPAIFYNLLLTARKR